MPLQRRSCDGSDVSRPASGHRRRTALAKRGSSGAEAPVVRAESLSKRFGGVVAVDDLSFELEQSTITGFLGPNGAGKTTTLRMLLGLAKPSSGRAFIFGQPYAELAEPSRQVGAVLEATDFHPGRSGRDHLRMLAEAVDLPRSRVEEVLRLVELQEAARRRVKTYSLGMRQRLGLATALLGDPELLILDEPANGLDPEGMRWMRGLLREFADRGGTVLLSSHLLREVEAVADQLVIIGGGKIVASGSREELMAKAGTVVRATDAEALESALIYAALKPRSDSNGGFVVDAEPRAVGAAALAGGVVLTHLAAAQDAGLEQLFFDLTSGGAENGAEPRDRVEASDEVEANR